MNKLAQQIFQHFTQHNLTLSLAESCTGGAISAQLTEIPGASDFFLGAIVCYTLPVKYKTLNVQPKTVEEYGVVSTQVATEMAKGAIDYFESDWSLSITGIAGPSGGTPDKPVGSVEIGIANKSSQEVKTISLALTGPRVEIIQQAKEQALAYLYDVVKQ